MPKTRTSYRKGRSGNPSGRPQGSRNKASLAADALFEGEAEGLARKAIEMALAGDIAALKICIERICPPRRDRPIKLELPKIERVDDILRATVRVLEAVSKGVITPAEGHMLTALIEVQRKCFETVDLEKRLAEFEREAIR